jgi:hypothetical protein
MATDVVCPVRRLGMCRWMAASRISASIKVVSTICGLPGPLDYKMLGTEPNERA